MASAAEARKAELVGLVRRLQRDFKRLTVLTGAEGHAFIDVPELSEEQQPEQNAEGASTSKKAVGDEERAENGSVDLADNQSLPKDGVQEPPVPSQDHAVEEQRPDQIRWCSSSIKGYEWVLHESVRSAVGSAAEKPLIVTNDEPRGLLTLQELSELVKIRHVDCCPLLAAVMDAVNELEGTKKNNPRSKVKVVPRWFPGPLAAYAARVQDMNLAQLLSVLDAIIDYIRGRWEEQPSGDAEKKYPRWPLKKIKTFRSNIFKDPTWHPLVNNLGAWAGVNCFFDALEAEAASPGPKPSGPALAARTDADLHKIWDEYVQKKEEKAEKRKRQRQNASEADPAAGGVGPVPGLSPSVGTPPTPAYQERQQPSNLTGHQSGEQPSHSSVSRPDYPSPMVASQPAPRSGTGAERNAPVPLTLERSRGSQYSPAPFPGDAMEEDQEGSSRGGGHFGPGGIFRPPEGVLRELPTHRDSRPAGLETETVPLSGRPVPNARGGRSVRGRRRSGGRNQRAQERGLERSMTPPRQQQQGLERLGGVHRAEQPGSEQLLAPPGQQQQRLGWHHQAQERGPEGFVVLRTLQQPGLEGSVGVHRAEQRGFERSVVPPGPQQQGLEWPVEMHRAQDRGLEGPMVPPMLPPQGLEWPVGMNQAQDQGVEEPVVPPGPQPQESDWAAALLQPQERGFRPPALQEQEQELAVGSLGLQEWGPEHLFDQSEEQWGLAGMRVDSPELREVLQNGGEGDLFLATLFKSSDQVAADLLQQEGIQDPAAWGGGSNESPAAVSPQDQLSQSLRRDLAPLLETVVRRAEARNRNGGQARQELPRPPIPSPRTLQRMNARNAQQRMVGAVVPVEWEPNRLSAPNLSPTTSLVKREPKAGSPKRRLALPAGVALQKLVLRTVELIVKRGFASDVSNRDKQKVEGDPPSEQDSPGPNRAHSAPPELLQARLEERSPRTGRRRRRASTGGGSIPSPEGWQETVEPFLVPRSPLPSARVKAEPIVEGTESETEPCEEFPMRRQVFQEQGLGRGGVNSPTAGGDGVNGGVQIGVKSPPVSGGGVNGGVQAAGASGVQDRPLLGLSPGARVHTSPPIEAQGGVKAEVRMLLAGSDSVPVSETVAPVMEPVLRARALESTTRQAAANPSDGADAVSGGAGLAADGKDGTSDATDAGSSVGADAPTGGAESVADSADGSPDGTDAGYSDGADALTGGAEFAANGTDGSPDDTDAEYSDGADVLTGAADPVMNGTDGSADGSSDGISNGADASSDESLDGEEVSDEAGGTEGVEDVNQKRHEYCNGVSNGTTGQREARADKRNALGTTAELDTFVRAPHAAGRREHPGAAARAHHVDIAAARDKTPGAKSGPRANGFVAARVSDAAATVCPLGGSLGARIVQKERRAAELEDFIAILEKRMAALWASASELSREIGPAESDGWETPSSVLQAHPTAKSAISAGMRSPLGHK